MKGKMFAMRDILFTTDEGIFSYRVAGVCVHDGYVLLQNTDSDPSYAFPGGHVAFGETNEEALVREFYEEIGARIKVGSLISAAEIFFPWNGKPCHQICLYYNIELVGGDVHESGSFKAREQIEGREFDILYHWVPIDSLDKAELYPPQMKKLLLNGTDGAAHFVYKEV